MNTVLDNPVIFLAEAALSRENEMKSIVARHRPLPSPLGDHLPSGVSRPIWVGGSDMAEQGEGVPYFFSPDLGDFQERPGNLIF